MIQSNKSPLITTHTHTDTACRCSSAPPPTPRVHEQTHTSVGSFFLAALLKGRNTWPVFRGIRKTLRLICCWLGAVHMGLYGDSQRQGHSRPSAFWRHNFHQSKKKSSQSEFYIAHSSSRSWPHPIKGSCLVLRESQARSHNSRERSGQCSPQT